MQRKDVKLSLIQENLDGELSDVIFYKCDFCEKTVGLHREQRKWLEKLSGNRFFCTFCIQNGLHVNNRHVLPMSFRAIVGYFYCALYLETKNLYVSQILDYLESHEKIGLANPVFRYDPDSLMWFVDFAKVGKGKRKIPLREVLKTTIDISACFSLPANISCFQTSKLFAKYEEALVKFHMERYRPPGKRLLIPTLTGCGNCDNKQVDHESLKNFSKHNIIMR